MAKITAKDGIVLIDGYNLSTYVTQYEIADTVDEVEVTGLSEGSHNFIPGQRMASLSLNTLWDSAASKTVTVLRPLNLAGKIVTLLPEGYVLGAPTISLPIMQANWGPTGSPSTAIVADSVKFLSYGNNAGVEDGYALAHGTITTTTTGTGYDDLLGAAATASCAGALHVWGATTTDTYVVKIQHSASLGSGYADLITFTLNGTALGSERVAVASGTVNRYRRVVATRTGAAGDSFGFSVHFWRSW
jgi:hypothetical protein